MLRNPSRNPIREWLPLLGLAVLYYVGARFGLLLALEKSNSTPVWPPAGIALAGMLLIGRRAWPAVALGAFMANWVAFSANHAATLSKIIGASGAIACGNSLEALAGWWICARWLAPGARAALGVRDEMLFGRMTVFQFAGAALLCSLASAAVGPATVCAMGISPWTDWPLVAFTWWAGDSTGMLYVTPLLLGFVRTAPIRWPAWRMGEGVLAFAVLALTSWVVFFAITSGSQAMALKFICIAPLIWIALRVGLMGTVSGIAVPALFAIVNTRQRVGPYLNHTEIGMVLLLLAYLWVVGVTCLTLARSVAIQQQVQASLREANASLEAMMSAIPALVMVANDRECRRITGNQLTHNLLHVPPGDNLSMSAPGPKRPRPFEVRVNGRSVPEEDLAMQKAAATGKPVFGEEQELIFSDGDVRYIYGNAVPLLGDNGTSQGSIAVFVDVTERRRAELALREGEERFRIMAESAPVMIWMSGPDKLCNFFNKSWLEFTGRTMEQELGSGWAEEVHPDDLQGCLDIYLSSFDARKEFRMEYRLKRHDGEYRWIMDHGVPRFAAGQEFVGYIGSCVDIHESKRAGEELRAKQSELERITSLTPVMLTRCSRDLHYEFVNRAYADRFGMTPDKIVGRPIREIMGEEAYETIKPHVEAVLQGSPVEYEVEVPYERIGPRTIRVAYAPDRDAQGQVVGWFSSIFDVTELRRLEERFRLAVQAAPCGMLMADPEGRIVLANMHAEKLFGYGKDELIGHHVDMLVPQRFRQRQPGHRDSNSDASSARPMGAGRDLYALRKDGSEVPVEIGLSPIRTEQGTMVLNSIVDITERKNAEEALRRLNEELEERVKLRTAALGQANEKLNTEMAERRRLEKQILEIAELAQRQFGQELHEGLGQELAGIWFLCNVLADKLKKEAHPEASAVAELARLLHASLDATRNLARTSYPVELETSGLLVALEALAERTDGLFNVHCTLRCDWPQMFTLPAQLGIHVYRVVQEALTNALKHGHPQNIVIECRTGAGARTITVTDDGEGFAPPSESAGMGLHLMRYRAQLVGAKLDVRRASEKGGCLVTCTIPTRS